METINPAEVFYFSEGGEDFLLWSLFEYRREGTYLDVGAFDGRYLSNSLSFCQAGWRGVCVEPVAEFRDLCAINQPGAVCVHAACVARADIGSVRFHSEPLGVYSRLEPGADAEARLRESYDRYGSVFPGFREIEVPAVTVSRLIDEHLTGRAPDFLSIDVEGMEILVLEGLDFDRHRPRVIVAEANDDSGKDALVSWLDRRGYALIRSIGNNHFFSAETELVERGRSTRIKCVIERQLHPKGLQFTFRGIALGKAIDEAQSEELATVRRRNLELMHELEVLRKSQNQPEAELTRALHSVDALGARIGELQRSLETCRRQRSQVEHELADARVRTDKTGREAGALRARVAEFEQSLATCREHRTALERNLAAARADLQRADLTIARHFLVPRPRLFRRRPQSS